MTDKKKSSDVVYSNGKKTKKIPLNDYRDDLEPQKIYDLLKKGDVLPSERDENGKTIIFKVSRHNDKDGIECILKILKEYPEIVNQSIQCNTCTTQSILDFFCTFPWNHAPIVAYICQNDHQHVNSLNALGKTPFETACMIEDGAKPDIIITLINYGMIDITKEYHGNRPLAILPRSILNDESIKEMLSIGIQERDLLLAMSQKESPWKMYADEIEKQKKK